MYIMIDSASALVIDPHPASDVLKLLNDRGVDDCTILLTHEHVDHTWGVNELGAHFKKIELVCHKNCAAVLGNPDLEKSSYVVAMLAIQDYRQGTKNASFFRENFHSCQYGANRTFDQNCEFLCKGMHITMTATPGHSPGSCCVICDRDIIFTGDSLMRDSPVIFRIRGGNRQIYKEHTLPFFASLDKGMHAFPGHGGEFRLYEMDIRREHVGTAEI